MELVPDSNQPEAQSFEISKWFTTILNRIDNIQIHQNYLIKWRNLALKLKRSKRIARFKYVYDKFRQKKCSKSSKSNWLLFYSKLWHRKKKYTFNMARNQLSDAKQRAEDLRRAKKILMIPESDSEYETEYDKNQNSDSYANKYQYDDLSPNAQKWISMANRFVSQTKYNELQQAYQDYLEDLKYQEHERRNTWKEMAHTLLWNIQKNHIKICHKKYKQARQNWIDMYSNYVLTYKLNHIKKVYLKWNTLSLKTDSQVRRCWKRFYFSMRFKQNIIRMVKESSALSTLTNFFRYIILIRRSTAVAKYFPIRYVANIRSIVKQSTYDSAEKIRKFALKKVFRDNDIFADNWSNCIAEAFSNVASHQVGPPVSVERRRRRVKSSSDRRTKVIRKKKFNYDKIDNNHTTIQTIQNKVTPNPKKEQELSENPIKIIKITRDFDPNEEESEKEIIKYLSDSDGSSDGGNGKFNGTNNNNKMSTTEINHSKNDQIVIITSPKEKQPENSNILIEVNPSGSQSTGSIEEYNNNDNSDSINRYKRNDIFPYQNKANKAKLKIEPSVCQELKLNKTKKKQKTKELYAPIVIPKGMKSLSPIRKKRLTKTLGDYHDPSISEILGIVGIDSSLELLDEGSDVTNPDSSGIHFRFDDELSDPIDAPLKDLVVDLINVSSNDEERRIRQSLLEASQGSSNPPNNEEEEKRLPNLKEERKIDLMKSNQINNQENAVLPQHNISSSPSSYNSNSDFGKEKEYPEEKNEKKKESENNADTNILFEEEEEEIDDIPKDNTSDEKTGLIKNIGNKEDENDHLHNDNISDEKTDLIKNIGNEEEDKIILQMEEEDISCQFNFESDKNLSKSTNSIKASSHSLHETKSLEGPSDSYISDRDVDAAMHEYSSDNTTQ